MPVRTEHETVGRVFEFGGARYRCTRWQRNAGFWMRLINGRDDLFPERTVGYETCVSERAIDRTFHRDHTNQSLVAHEQSCDCYVCEGREV